MIVGNGYKIPHNATQHAFQTRTRQRNYFTCPLGSDAELYIIKRYGKDDDFNPKNVHPRGYMEFMHEKLRIDAILSTNVCQIVPPNSGARHNGLDLRPGDLTIVHNTLELAAITLDGESRIYRVSLTSPAAADGGRDRSHSLTLSTLLTESAHDLNIPLKNSRVVMGGGVNYGAGFSTPNVEFFQKNGAQILTTTGISEATFAKEFGMEIATIAITADVAPLDAPPEKTYTLSEWGIKVAVEKSRVAERILEYAATLWATLTEQKK